MGNWDQANNLLAVRLDATGDVLMTVPAIRALKQSMPGRRVTLLTSPPGAQAAALVPEIDQTIIYQAPWMKASTPHRDSHKDHGIIERLARERFDGAVVFTVYTQSPLPAAMFCYLANIPRRLAHCRENPYQILTDWIPEVEPERTIRHEVRRQLDLVASIGCATADERMSVCVPRVARRRVTRLWDQFGLNGPQPAIVMHTGATAPSRRYPSEGFAEVGRRLVRELGCQLILTGSEEESEQVEAIRQAMGVASHNLAGRLTLADLAALLTRATLLVSNNSGPVHVAAAVGTPVVDIYALTNPQHTPWGVPHRVLSHDVPCKYCYKSVCPEGHHHCLRLISPEEVVKAVVELLASTQAVPPRNGRNPFALQA
jgi:lipopolysaccharide heptosyltransferase II